MQLGGKVDGVVGRVLGDVDDLLRNMAAAHHVEDGRYRHRVHFDQPNEVKKGGS